MQTQTQVSFHDCPLPPWTGYVSPCQQWVLDAVTADGWDTLAPGVQAFHAQVIQNAQAAAVQAQADCLQHGRSESAAPSPAARLTLALATRVSNKPGARDPGAGAGRARTRLQVGFANPAPCETYDIAMFSTARAAWEMYTPTVGTAFGQWRFGTPKFGTGLSVEGLGVPLAPDGVLYVGVAKGVYDAYEASIGAVANVIGEVSIAIQGGVCQTFPALPSAVIPSTLDPARVVGTPHLIEAQAAWTNANTTYAVNRVLLFVEELSELGGPNITYFALCGNNAYTVCNSGNQRTDLKNPLYEGPAGPYVYIGGTPEASTLMLYQSGAPQRPLVGIGFTNKGSGNNRYRISVVDYNANIDITNGGQLLEQISRYLSFSGGSGEHPQNCVFECRQPVIRSQEFNQVSIAFSALYRNPSRLDQLSELGRITVTLTNPVSFPLVVFISLMPPGTAASHVMLQLDAYATRTVVFTGAFPATTAAHYTNAISLYFARQWNVTTAVEGFSFNPAWSNSGESEFTATDTGSWSPVEFGIVPTVAGVLTPAPQAATLTVHYGHPLTPDSVCYVDIPVRVSYQWSVGGEQTSITYTSRVPLFTFGRGRVIMGHARPLVRFTGTPVHMGPQERIGFPTLTDLITGATYQGTSLLTPAVTQALAMARTHIESQGGIVTATVLVNDTAILYFPFQSTMTQATAGTLPADAVDVCLWM